MPSLDDIYKTESRFLKAADLKTEKGFAKVVVEISDSEIVSGNDGKSQIVLHFKDKEKVLGLNKINAERIAAHTGSRNSDDWNGWKIRLYVEKVQKPDGSLVDGIRVSSEYCEEPASQPKTMAATASTSQASHEREGFGQGDESVPF